MRVYELGKKSLYWKNGWRTRGDSFANFFDGHQPDEEAARKLFSSAADQDPSLQQNGVIKFPL